MIKRTGIIKVAILFLLILAAPLLSGCFTLLAGGSIKDEVIPDSVKSDFYASYTGLIMSALTSLSQ
jgi:predicted small secreted protein